MRKKITILTVGLAAMFASVPAQAAFDEGGGGASPSVVSGATDGFDWADAGIGAGIGAVIVATLGAGAAVRHHHGRTERLARPVAQ